MANTNPTIVAASLSDDELKNSINSLVTHIDEKMKEMVESTNSAVDAMERKLKSLDNIKKDSGGSADSGASKRTKAQNAEISAVKESTQAHKEKTLTLDQQASAINTAVRSEKKYTDEIRKQAQAIREMADYKKYGVVEVNGNTYYNPERSKIAKKDILSLEEQVLETIEREEKAELRLARATNERVEAQKEVAKKTTPLSEVVMPYNPISESLQKKSYDVLNAEKEAAIKRETQEYTQLEKIIAKANNVRIEELNIITRGTSSYANISASLNMMTKAYREMSESQRNSPLGKELADDIQHLQRNLQKAQAQMSRPVDLKSALGYDEKTLDDIAFKIRQLQSYKQGIDLTKPNAAQEIRSVDNEINRLNKDLNKYLSTSKQATEINRALSRSWNYMKNRLAFYFTVGASTALIKNLIAVRSEYEMNEKALGILIDSAEKGSQIFNELSQMALVSPYTLIELSGAAKQLVAYDIAAKDVVDTTRRLADMASAVGVPIERLTYALGQIKAYGYLNSRDARMFLNAGIPLVKELADYYTELEGRLVTTGDVYDRMKKKAVDYSDVMHVINKMTDEGGKFFDFQAKMAETLKVQLANLTLAWNNMLNEIGESNQLLITAPIKGLKTLFKNWEEINKLIYSFVFTYAGLKIVMLGILSNMGALGKRMAWNIIIGKKFTNVMWGLGEAIKKAFTTNAVATFGGIATLAFTNLAIAIYSAWENQIKLNNAIREGAKESASSIERFFKDYSEVYKGLYEWTPTTRGTMAIRTDLEGNKITKNLDDETAKKTWDTIRDEIEKSSSASDHFIHRLETIENVSDRVREGFELLQDIKDVDGALQNMDVAAIRVEQDWSKWWNLWAGPDGLVSNIRDFGEELDKVARVYGNIENARVQAESSAVAQDVVSNYDDQYQRMMNDIRTTTESMYNAFASVGIVSVDKMKEAYEKSWSNILSGAQLNTKEQLAVRMAAEKDFIDYKSDLFDKEWAFEVRQGNEERANRVLEEKKAWIESFGEGEVLSKSFFDWLKTQHSSQISKMLGTMSKKEIDQINWSKSEWAKWAEENAQSFAKQMGISFDKLKKLVNDANTMKIFLKLNFVNDNEDESVYGALTKADQDADEANKKLKRLQVRITELEKNGKKATEEYTNATKEQTNAQNDLNDALARGGHIKKDLKDPKGSKKDILGEALTKEVQLVGEIQKRYEEYRKIGLNTTESLAKATDEYGNSLKNVGATLSKYGIATKTPEELANMDLVKVRDYYKELLKGAKALGNAKGIEAIEKALANINVEIEKFSHKKIVDSLNNELGKIKDEYELAVELDATPEMSSVFMDAMGLSREDLEQLPRTYSQLAKKLQESIDKVFKDEGKDIKFDLENTLNDDEFKAWVEKNGHLLEAGWVEALNKIREFAQKTRLEEVKDTTKTWNELIGKYGGLSDKLLKITRDAISEEMGVIKQFGSKEQIERAFQITDDLKIKKDPLEVARLSRELMELLQAVIQDNPKAISIASAITTQEGRDKSKAEWDEFKNSDLYTMTFENMDKLSVRAIKHISEELDNLKDKVKEDPASMKALMKSYEDLQDAMIKRRPFESVITSLKDWKKAAKEVKDAKIKLDEANKEVDQAESYKESAEDVGELAMAEEKLTKAKEKQAKAQNDMLAAENKQARAQKNFQESLNGSASSLNNFASLLKQVTDLLGIAEDSEAGQLINEMIKGFQTMATVLTTIASIAIIVAAGFGWVAVVVAALGALIGLLTWLSNRKDNKIVKKIKESEAAVKDLELAYKKLKNAVEDAFGTAQVGAQSLLIVNKRLQLEETKRQLELQKQRRGKKYDADAIRDLESQVVDLEKEINDGIKEMTDTLLGTSGVGDAVENMIGSVIDALRSGEDAIDSWNDSIDDMIYNMIKKFVSTKYLGPIMTKIFDDMSADLDEKGKVYKDEAADVQRQINAFRAKNEKGVYNKVIAQLEKRYDQLIAKAEEAATPEEEDILRWGAEISSLRGYVQGAINLVEDLSEAAGLQLGGGKELSALQQGIQGITEDTAGAIEAYMNIVSQRIFENGNILSEIRDAVVSFDMDIQLGTLSQMLLQLQASYQVQVSIQNILNGVLNPSGRAFVVELNS